MPDIPLHLTSAARRPSLSGPPRRRRAAALAAAAVLAAVAGALGPGTASARTVGIAGTETAADMRAAGVVVTFRFRTGAGPHTLLRLRENRLAVVRSRGGVLAVVSPRRGTVAGVRVRGRGWHRAHVRVDAERGRVRLSVGRRSDSARTPLVPEAGVVLGRAASRADVSGVRVRSTRQPVPAAWAAPNPFDGVRIANRLDDPARGQYRAWRRVRPADADLIARIASQPRAAWLGDWTADVRRSADREVTAAARARALPVLVAYAIPQRDCGGHSAGGLAGGDAYRAWVRSLAAGIGSRPAAVILEPDALAQADCLPADARAERLALLADAVDVLGALPRTSVYIDAGHPAWIPVGRMAVLLREAGVTRARGFALNVASSRSDAEVRAYGGALSRRLGGARFVADTGRNGAGPAADGSWCNPPGLGLGRPPAAATDEGPLDARLWVKPPGESDGPCNGGPDAGRWWADYALGLAARAVPQE